MKSRLKDKVSGIFFKMVVLPFLFITIFLSILFMLFRGYMFDKISSIEVNKAKNILQTVIDSQKQTIEHEFLDIELYSKILRKEHEKLFLHKNINNSDIKFNFAKNGVFYKTTKNGSSLYYSSSTKITEKERLKALFTEEMDSSFKTIVDNSDLVVATYFNSYDNMNRIYPYIDNIYDVYGSSVNIQDYNFYYLADKKHNPKKELVWTDSYLDPAGNGWMISCITPIYNGDFLEGVTGIDITVDKIINNILDKKLPFSTNIALISKSGTITAMSQDIKNLLNIKELKIKNHTQYIKKTITRPEEFNIFKNKNLFATKIANILTNHIKIEEIDIAGNIYIIFNEKIKFAESTLIFCVKKSNVLKTLDSIKRQSLEIIFSLAFIFILVLLVMHRIALREFKNLFGNIVDPITVLSNVSSNIKKYRNNMPKIDTSILEIDELSDNFSKMVQELHLKSLKLKGFNKTLESMVDEATKKLVDKNQTMNTLLDTIMEAVTIFDEDYNLIQVNDVAVKIFKYDGVEDMLGKNIFDFIPQEERYKAKDALSKQSIIPYEITLYKKDKTLFPTLVKGHDATVNGKIYRITTVIDLTDIKMKDKQLLQQSKHAQMGEMIGMIAHQWRQPLNAISASSINLSLLSSMKILEDSKIQEDSIFIQNQCQKMSSTIDTFMNFVKPSQESKEFKIIDTLNAIMQIMGIQLTNHNIEVEIFEKNKNVTLVGHEDLLEQVIINILSNARDAFEEIEIAEKFIKIDIEQIGNTPIIKIEDNAGGIPEHISEKIFNPYFTTKEQGKGTGLGLYMSKDIMTKSFSGDLVYNLTKDGSLFEVICGEIK